MKSREHIWIYVVAAVVVVALMVVGALLYEHGEDNAVAHAKARDAIALLHEAGLPAPSEQRMVDVFGSDGGSMAENPDDFFEQNFHTLMQGSGGVIATRPLILGYELFKGEEILLAVYAPEKLPAFKKYVRSLKLTEMN